MTIQWCPGRAVCAAASSKHEYRVARCRAVIMLAFVAQASATVIPTTPFVSANVNYSMWLSATVLHGDPETNIVPSTELHAHLDE